jgi:signal transduction histidine kinase
MRSPEQQHVYEQVDALINTASQEVRRISHNMAPHALRLSGLHDAVADLANQLNNPDLDVEFQWFGAEDRIAESAEIMLYRIIQELTNNVIKYADAKLLHIQVNRFDDELSLIVEDDGLGFDLETVQRANGLGLRSVQSRVEFLKGTMDIDTRPGNGTSVSVRIPL